MRLVIPHAYIDPGSGSMMIQVIVAGALGAMYAFKRYIAMFFGFLFKPFKKKDTTEDGSQVNEKESV
jgi:hypothetical protein